MAETKKKAVKKEEAAEETKKAPKAKKETAEKKAAPKAKKATKKAEEKPAEKKVEKKAEEKPAEPKKEVHQAIAVAKGVRVTPRKIRLVLDVVRGRDVDDALKLLKVINKSASSAVYKVIKSAAANATNNFGLDYDALYVAEIQVSDAFRIKRFIPRAKGSASSIIKRNSNIRVIVKERR